MVENLKQIESLVIQTISHAVGGSFSPSEILQADSMRDLSLSSLSFISVLFELQKVTGISVGEANKKILHSDSVSSLIAYVKKNTKRK